MLKQSALKTLLQLDVPENATSILIYVEQISPRLNYVCEFIFKHVLKLNYTITSIKAEFLASSSVKLNYSHEIIPEVLQILPQGLVYETGISEKKPEPIFQNDCLYFYPAPLNPQETSSLFHFDLFSSIFYLISRYEEWQSFKPDSHQRFEVEQSCLYQNSFHLKPLIEQWLIEFQEAFLNLYPTFVFPTKHFQVLSTIDVDNLYAYKSKGLLRTIGAGMKDILKGDFFNLKERIAVVFNKKKDPFDIYEEVSDFCFENKIPLIYFFLFRTGDHFNRTVNPKSKAFKNVFQTLKANKAIIAVHPSYEAAYQERFLREELTQLSQQVNEPITNSRQHYLRFDIKSTPKHLLKNGIQCDFTMGYASQPGFRAGTSHPFYYYDFDAEKTSELLFVPFCMMDGAYTVYSSRNSKEALDDMLKMAKDIKKVNGYYISVFHERSFSNHLYPGFGTLYKKLHTMLKAL